jgi:hypothetical protein
MVTFTTEWLTSPNDEPQISKVQEENALRARARLNSTSFIKNPSFYHFYQRFTKPIFFFYFFYPLEHLHHYQPSFLRLLIELHQLSSKTPRFGRSALPQFRQRFANSTGQSQDESTS